MNFSFFSSSLPERPERVHVTIEEHYFGDSVAPALAGRKQPEPKCARYACLSFPPSQNLKLASLVSESMFINDEE